jgi:two-component system, sensor histidine kinase
LSQLRVLVVDDSRSNAYQIASMARSFGCQVRLTTEGAEAVQMAGDWRPEIVLLDLLMPGMDGFEVAERLRADYTEARIVAVTALDEHDERVQKAGFDRHLTKPVRRDTLRRVIWELASD